MQKDVFRLENCKKNCIISFRNSFPNTHNDSCYFRPLKMFYVLPALSTNEIFKKELYVMVTLVVISLVSLFCNIVFKSCAANSSNILSLFQSWRKDVNNVLKVCFLS